MQDSAADRHRRARRMVGAAVLATMLTLTLQVAPALADPALAGQWRFDEASGQVAFDDGPFGLHGVLGARLDADGEDPIRIFGSSGGVLRFSGDSHVQVADGGRLELQRLTVEVTARATGSPGAHRYLVARGSRGCFSGSYGLYTAANGGLAFYVFDGERYFVSASARPGEVWNGAWHRLTGTFDGVALRAFVDGREIGAPLRTSDGTAIEFESMPDGTGFGSYLGSCRLPFSGDVDTVRIWSGAASPAAIAAQAGVTQGAPQTAPGAPGATPPAVAAGAPAKVIRTQPPAASCRVWASRRQIPARRRVAVIVRASGLRRPLRRVRVSVRRAGGRKVLAVRRTNVRGIVKVRLRIPTGGRLRVGVIGRANCTPAFITVKKRGA